MVKRSTTSPGSFTIPCDHAIEFIDLGKAVFLFFLNSNSVSIDSHFTVSWRAVNRLMKRGWGQRGTDCRDVEHFIHGQQGEKGW